MHYNISFTVCGIILTLFTLIITRVQYPKHDRSIRLFRRMVMLILVADCADICSAEAIEAYQTLPVWTNYLANLFYFAMVVICIFYAITYLSETLGLREKMGLMVGRILMCLYMAVLFANCWTGWIFTVDAVNGYQHGPLFDITYGIEGFILLYMLAALISGYKRIDRRRFSACVVILGLILVTTLMQLIFIPSVLIEFFGVSLSALIMLFSLETPDFQQLKYLQDNLKDEVKRQTDIAVERQHHIEQLSLQVVDALAQSVDAKDEYTNGHSTRVAEYSELLAKELGWPADRVQSVKLGALLHDIGKIGVPDAVLNKAGRLTDEEFAVIKQHPVIGSNILINVTALPLAYEIARHHHERYDGKGYPDGLSGTDIPQAARLVAIADAYDAMSSNRIYRRNLTPEHVRAELERGRGTQFDPDMCDAFLKMLDEGRVVIEHPYIMPEWAGTQSDDESELDYLSGLLRRIEGERRIRHRMAETGGCLVCLDVDNLKNINYRLGHTIGDRMIAAIGFCLRQNPADGVAFRYGGDEFVWYIPERDSNRARAQVHSLLDRLKTQGGDGLPGMSLSVGFCMAVPGDDYNEIFRRADKALFYVKMTGKGEIFQYGSEIMEGEVRADADLENLVANLSSSEDAPVHSVGADFVSRLRGILAGHDRSNRASRVVLITLNETDGLCLDEIDQAMICMDNAIHTMLRSSDLYTRYSSMQFLILLMDADANTCSLVMDRIFARFYRESGVKGIVPSYAIAPVDKEKTS